MQRINRISNNRLDITHSFTSGEIRMINRMRRLFVLLLSVSLLVVYMPLESHKALAEGPLPLLPIPIPPIPIVIPDPDPEVDFPDSQLKSWAQREVNRYMQPIHQSDVDAYCEEFNRLGKTELILVTGNSTKLRSLEGIQSFSKCNIQSINISNEEISDLTPLTALTTLTEIFAINNKIEEVRSLQHLEGLTTLVLRQNKIGSLVGLENLTNLNKLDVYSNEISNLAPIRNLTALESLNVTANNITDLEPIRGLTALKWLTVSSNPIRSLEPISGLTELMNLEMSNLDLHSDTEMKHISNLTSLSQLNIGFNSIADITPLRNLTNLRVFDAFQNHIKDLTPISELTNLDILGLANNRIKDITPLQNLTNLTILGASGNWISDLHPIQSIKFQRVVLNNNRIDETAMTNLPALLTWTRHGTEIYLSDQDLNKEYPFEEESPIGSDPGSSDGHVDPAPGAGEPGLGGVAPIVRGPHNFTDIAGHWAEADIQWAYERGMVNGVAEGIFQPTGTTTEEQFLKMLLIAMGALTEEPVSVPWSQKYYDFALDYRYPVHPEIRSQIMTRTQVAELIAATQGERLTGERAIQYLLDKGLSNGKTAATIEGYAGGDTLTRAEAVRFIRNVLNKAEHQIPQRLSEH